MKILVTGSAGFIGFHLVKTLLQHGHHIVGIDNLNDYYDVSLKLARLKNILNFCSENNIENTYSFQKLDLSDKDKILSLFTTEAFDIVINLAAQAGVRYSLENPHAYITSNIAGFLNILEGCRHSNVKHLLFASSSSVYGMNSQQPFNTNDNVDFPISLYAATKKSNELMAHTYSHLYELPCTGLRFFTVYGPWGRPDMAVFKFVKAIFENKSIDLYNHGNMRRDFTYIDDIINGICQLIDVIPSPQNLVNTNSHAPFKLYNIGNNQPEELKTLLKEIEDACGKQANINLLPMQAGDVPETFANIDDLYNTTGFKPTTSLKNGVTNFVNWYKVFYQI